MPSLLCFLSQQQKANHQKRLSPLFLLTPYAFFLTLLFVPPLLADWGPDVRLTFQSNGNAFTTGHGWCLAADSSGSVHVTWTDTRDTSGNVYYKEGSDTVWSPDTMISIFDPVYWNSDPSVDLDRFGVLHVIWWYLNIEVPTLWYRYKDSGGWSRFE